MKRSDSTQQQFQQRIPADIRARAAGLKLEIPLGDGEFHHLTISPKADALRFSLRTRDPATAKIRLASVVGYLETVWKGLRATEPVNLTHRQAVALSGKLYRVWVSGEGKERATAVIHTPQGFVLDRSGFDEKEEEALFLSVSERLQSARSSGDAADLEPTLGPIVNRLLLAQGVAEVDAPSRAMLLTAFADALRDAFATRARNAAGDYSSDPKSERFPEWQAPESKAVAPPTSALPIAKASLTGLVDDWWKEAAKTGREPSTHESYRNTMASFVA